MVGFFRVEIFICYTAMSLPNQLDYFVSILFTGNNCFTCNDNNVVIYFLKIFPNLMWKMFKSSINLPILLVLVIVSQK